MARSRSKQSRSRKASRKASRSSKSGRRSHHQRSSGESGLSRVLKLAERDYMIQTLDGFLDSTNVAAGSVPGVNFAGTSNSGKPEYYWKSFSLPELQAGFLQFNAQQRQLKKLQDVIKLYTTNVDGVSNALQTALTDKYNESIKLNQAIASGLKSGTLPMQTSFKFYEDLQKADFTDALTKKRNAIDKYLGVLSSAPASAASSASSASATPMSTPPTAVAGPTPGMYRGVYHRR